MLKRIVFLLVFLSVSIFMAGCDKLALSQGQEFKRKVTLFSKFNMSMFRNVDDKNAEMYLDMKVTDVDSDGTATVLVTIDKIESSISTLGYVFQFSCDEPEKNKKESSRPKLQEGYVDIFSKLVGKSYSAKVLKSGQVSELINIDPEIYKYTSSETNEKINGYNQAIMLLSEDSLKEYVSPGVYNGLPESQSDKIDTRMVLPSLPKFPAYRINSETPETDEATASWPTSVNKYYYKVKCDGVPDELATASSSDDEDAEEPQEFEQKDSRYISSTHSVIAAYGNGCVGYTKTGKFHELRERDVVEVASLRLNKSRNTGKKKRKVRMYYIVDKVIENID